MSLIFKEEGHKYISTDGAPIDWLSVTTLISHFKKPFDADVMAVKSSKNKKSKWYGMSPEAIKAAWLTESERSTTVGSWYHKMQEAVLLGGDGELLVDDQGNKIAENVDLEEGVFCERIVYLKSIGVCGSVDKIENHNGLVNLEDYKTYKRLDAVGFKGWDGTVSKMLSPIAHLDDCNLVHGALQMSTYLYIILRHNPSLKPGKLTLRHVEFEKESDDIHGFPVYRTDAGGNPIILRETPYDVPYLKDEVVAMFTWLKNNPGKIKRK